MPDKSETFQKYTNHDAADDGLSVDYRYRLRFTRGVFDAGNHTLAGVLPKPHGRPHRVLVCVDQGVAANWPNLEAAIDACFGVHRDLFTRVGDLQIVAGGEQVKNDAAAVQQVLQAINDAGICRQSFVLGIGGGAVLDVVGFAAATAHRGVRLIRVPTTTLAQADAGIGVKNGINAFGKKNFLGSFAVPWAVINDANFLTTLTDRDWRCGLSEAVKVALVKDGTFFDEIESMAPSLARRDEAAAGPIIERCAQLHLRHIIDGGDPFELTTARPLDFGHWAAHKLEQMSGWTLPHGEAVAIGIGLDVQYAAAIGMLPRADAERICACMEAIGFALYDPHMDDATTLLEGLEEFREHLGGELTVQLLDRIGRGVDVHEMRREHVTSAIAALQERARANR